MGSEHDGGIGGKHENVAVTSSSSEGEEEEEEEEEEEVRDGRRSKNLVECKKEDVQEWEYINNYEKERFKRRKNSRRQMLIRTQEVLIVNFRICFSFLSADYSSFVFLTRMNRSIYLK